jgi:hypothetical protein
MKALALAAIRVVALATALFICRALGSLLGGEQAAVGPMSAEQGEAAARALILVSLVHGGCLAYAISRSRWHGLRLAATLFWVLWGITTLLTQIEAVVFLPHVMPLNVVPRFLASGAITAGLFSPLAVLIMGKRRGEEDAADSVLRLGMPAVEWAWKLVVVAASYVLLYLLFGYFVAWQNPALREFYAGVRMPSWSGMVLLQMFRGLIWTAIAVPVIRMTQGRRWEAALAVALLFSGLMGALLLAPNPYMPDAVRPTHLVEVAASNFIFGWLLVWVLTSNIAHLTARYRLLSVNR